MRNRVNHHRDSKIHDIFGVRHMGLHPVFLCIKPYDEKNTAEQAATPVYAVFWVSSKKAPQCGAFWCSIGESNSGHLD